MNLFFIFFKLRFSGQRRLAPFQERRFISSNVFWRFRIQVSRPGLRRPLRVPNLFREGGGDRSLPELHEHLRPTSRRSEDHSPDTDLVISRHFLPF